MQAEKAPGTLPFILNFVEAMDPAEYSQAISAMTAQKAAYDSRTQCSDFSDELLAGTRKTYTKDTGIWCDDTRCTDT